jgi:hypothetical protein
MKELLTKSFWQGVKKTFYEAMEEPAKDDSPPVPVEVKEKTSSTEENSPPSSTQGGQQ